MLDKHYKIQYQLLSVHILALSLLQAQGLCHCLQAESRFLSSLAECMTLAEFLGLDEDTPAKRMHLMVCSGAHATMQSCLCISLNRHTSGHQSCMLLAVCCGAGSKDSEVCAAHHALQVWMPMCSLPCDEL